MLSFIGALKYFKQFLAGVPFNVITDSSALAWLKTSRDQSPCFERWWACVSSLTFTNQHRPGKRIVTEDALSRRPDLEHTTKPRDMLSLPDAEAHDLPDPIGLAPPSTLAAPMVQPCHERPPLDHDGVWADDSGDDSMPPTDRLPSSFHTCATLQSSTWRHKLVSILRKFSEPRALTSRNRNLTPTRGQMVNNLDLSTCGRKADLEETVTFHEFLDFARFGEELGFDLTMDDRYPVATALRPDTVASEMPGGSSYCMAVTRSRIAPAEPPASVSGSETSSSDSNPDDVPARQLDKHVQTWRRLHAVRRHPKLPMGGSPPDQTPQSNRLDDSATAPDAIMETSVDTTPWLKGLSRF